MQTRKWVYGMSVVLGLMTSFSCSKLTDEHNEFDSGDLKNSLFARILNTPDLSLFARYLQQTNHHRLLGVSGSYTVFAPSNSVMANLDPAIANDTAKLNRFIGNHIAYQLYRTTDVNTITRIAMVTGKYQNMLQKKIGDANITSADNFAANGLLQITDNFLPYLDNCWEFLSSTGAPAKQSAYMLSLFQKVFDTTNAVVIGIDANTGVPIYQPGTDSVFTNLFWNKVYDLRDEKKQYTFFMLTDAAWDGEVTKYKPYFTTSSTDSTTKAASWIVVSDLAVEGVYDPATVPDTILSKFNTKVPVTRNQIVRTVKTSNGIVYIMNKIDVQPNSKFKPIIIQGESYGATSHDRRNNTYFRDRFNPVTGQDFRDVLVFGHGVALFNMRYDLKEVPSIRYKAYWVALNDFQATTHTQKLAIGTAASATFPYTTVTVNNYNEVYIGEFLMPGYRPAFNIYLVGANSTTSSANALVCDYIKLVPSL
jgi:hypothetical protein